MIHSRRTFSIGTSACDYGMADLRASQTETEPFLEGRHIELTLESCADLVAELHEVATQILLQNVDVRL